MSLIERLRNAAAAIGDDVYAFAPLDTLPLASWAELLDEAADALEASESEDEQYVSDDRP